MRKILFFLFVCWGTIGMGVAQEQVKISRFQGERVTGLIFPGIRYYNPARRGYRCHIEYSVSL